jgi:hypothetical protein
MYANREEPNLKYILIDYLNGERPQYEKVELKILSVEPLTVSDTFANTFNLSLLEDQIRDKLQTLKKHRLYNLVLKDWRLVMKKIPGEDEFFYDILSKDWM